MTGAPEHRRPRSDRSAGSSADPAVSFSRVHGDERRRALATLVSAFTHDPVERWLYPGSREYQAHFPGFVEAFGGRAFDSGTVWQLADFSVVALWLPPGTEADGSAVVAQLSRTVTSDKHAAIDSMLDQLGTAHPRYPHWYLTWFGVASGAQGQGLGGELLARCLSIVDETRLPSYLESPNPGAVRFYERHGFVVTGSAQAGGCPPVSFMLRPARRD
ncbi:MAG TPA: GNAT family N-acetyltransferase [Thermoleophilia bacterium]|nr:GNAT family N-acetyltransferase [Thermoleophilia bacterium]